MGIYLSIQPEPAPQPAPDLIQIVAVIGHLNTFSALGVLVLVLRLQLLIRSVGLILWYQCEDDDEERFVGDAVLEHVSESVRAVLARARGKLGKL